MDCVNNNISGAAGLPVSSFNAKDELKRKYLDVMNAVNAREGGQGAEEAKYSALGSVP